MKTKKLLSLLLALMMMLSVVPFYASAAEVLSASNVTQWPTVSYNNGETMYFGQSVKDAVTLNGGTVAYNGTVVPGHFEFIDVNETPTLSGTQRSNIKFVPDNTDEYTGFESTRNRNVTYVVSQTTPVFVDEANDPVIATEVEAGAALSTSILSGGKAINPYNANEPKILAASWQWLNPSIIVNESGYYEAYFIANGYNGLRAQVYVKVKGNKVATTITEAPTVADMTYGATRNDIVLVGGKAMAGDTEVAGTFTLNYTDDAVMNLGTYNLAITFTPDDTEAYLPSTGTATVTVNKAKIAFVDENGADIVPEITVPYGTTFSSGDAICIALKSKLNVVSGIASYVYVLDDEGNTIDSNTVAPVGTKKYKVRATTDNKNYEEAVLTFKLTVEPTDVKVEIKSIVNEILVTKANLNDPTPTGTFAIYVDGQLLKDGVKHNETVEWNPTASKTYEIKAVYTPAENDPVSVEDVTATTPVTLERKITYVSDNVHGGNPSYLCGATVTLSANASAESFEGWVITDANGNEVDLGVDLTALNITFTMPDYDLNIEAKIKGATGGTTGGIDDILGGLGDLGNLTEGDSDNAILNIFNNIIAWIKNIINTIIELFRSIGDNT